MNFEKTENNVDLLVKILGAQNELLDCMLLEQTEIHENVIQRNWNKLEANISRFDAFSNAFVELDENREKAAGNDRSIYFNPQVQPLLVQVRTKLAKSKIENQALKVYVDSTQEFISGVLEECVPQERNTLYTPYGQIVKPQANSLVLNTVF